MGQWNGVIVLSPRRVALARFTWPPSPSASTSGCTPPATQPASAPCAIWASRATPETWWASTGTLALAVAMRVPSPAAGTSSPRGNGPRRSRAPPGSRSWTRSAAATVWTTLPRRNKMKYTLSQQIKSVCRWNWLARTKFRKS